MALAGSLTARDIAFKTLAARVADLTVKLASTSGFDAGSLGFALVTAWGPDADVARAAVVLTGGEKASVLALGGGWLRSWLGC